MFPVIARAMRFCRSCDHDGDGLPENEGADQTFDMWRFQGINVYTAGVVLAALLAYRRMASLVGDVRQARVAERWFARASATFDARLWNGRYFIACAGTRERYEACMTAQLVGQWAAHLLGLGYIVDPRKVQVAVRTMLTRNATASRFGAPNALRPDGRLDRASRHAQTIWPGQCYALSALAIYEGFEREGLALARRTWETFATYHRNPWNQPDVLFPDDGRYGFGDAYMRSMVIWAIPIALARRNRRLASGLRRVCAPARTRVPSPPAARKARRWR
jgi:non-lysosomal glucosylceramidase